MSKAVRWQVPFAAQDGTKYRVDIYDEGYTGSPVQLTAGETPFTTDEDDSDDFFAPVRTQSGTLQICTETPSGSTIKLEDILPANNIARPVRLLNISNSNAVEWQGFLSCEAYSQDYIGIPQNLDLPLIGVLEAMDSVYMKSVGGLRTINEVVYTALNNIETESGMYHTNAIWKNIYYSASAYRIFQQRMNDLSLYEEDEIQASDSLTYIMKGISCKEVLARICTFMGWVARESGQDIYLEAIGEPIGMYKESLGGFRYNFNTYATFVELSTVNISTLSWMGNNHKKSITQGANRVEVVAKLDNINAELKLPDFPSNNPTTGFGTNTKGPYNGALATLYPWLIAEQNDAYYNICTFHYGVGTVVAVSNQSYEWLTAVYNESTRENFLNHSYLKAGGISSSTKYTGAAFVKFSILNRPLGGYRENKQGLYCTLLPNLYEAHPQPIFTLRTVKQFLAPTGVMARLIVKARCYFIGYDRTNNQAIITEDISDEFLNIKYARYAPIVRWGNQYYSSGWNDWKGYGSASGADCEFVKGGFEIIIPLNGGENGDIEIGLPPRYYIDNRDKNTLYEVIFTELSVKMEYSDDILWRDSDENRYITLLSTNFRDEIKVDVDLASDNFNRPSISNLYNSTYGLLKTIDYTVSGGTEARRPEVDLLNRLAAYYGAARQRLELEVAHISTPLPQLRLNGINDGKVYLPMAESRDWRTGVCKLTCIECPQ